MFKKLRENIEIQHVNWNHFKCPNASINIFLQCMNYQFLQNAKVNIAILDHENITNNLIDYLPNMDHVFCKSEYSFSVISTALKQRGYSTANLVTTGWRSPNIEVGIDSKNFNKILIGPSGKVLKTFGSLTRPTSGAITREVEKYLQQELSEQVSG